MPKPMYFPIRGATSFFTVNCAARQDNNLLVEHVQLVRRSFYSVKSSHPFRLVAIVILPDHLHCIMTLPPDDHDFSLRWQLIKSGVSKHIAKNEEISHNRARKGERQLWQRSFMDHRIRNLTDLNRHIDYIHRNPVKHGLVERTADWPYSSFHRYVAKGHYDPNWTVRE